MSSLSKAFKSIGSSAVLGGIGFAVGGPVGGLIGLSIGSGLDAQQAAQAQADALRAAGRIEEAALIEARAFQAQILAETAPFREAGRAQLARLQAQQPGTSEFFKQQLEAGTGAIAVQQAALGLLDSTATQGQFGHLTGALLTQEEQQRQAAIGQAAQLSQLGFGQATGALQQQLGASGRFAQTIANIGAVEAQGQAAFGQAILPIATTLLGTQLAPPPAGGFNLQQGTGTQQFQPPTFGFGDEFQLRRPFT